MRNETIAIVQSTTNLKKKKTKTNNNNLAMIDLISFKS